MGEIKNEVKVEDTLTIVMVLYARPHVGGSGISGTQMAIELAKRGHDVHIVSYPNTYLTEEEKKYLTIHPIPNINYSSFKAMPIEMAFAGVIYNIAKTKGIDILQAHYNVTHAGAIIDARDSIILGMKNGELPKQERRPVAIITNRGTDISIHAFNPLLSPSMQLRLSQADEFTFVSHALQDLAKKAFNLPHYGKVIHNFVDEGRFSNHVEERKLLRKKLNINEDTVVFYHVSNFRPVKNIPVIVEAYFRAKISNNITNTKLLFIGDGEMRTKIEEMVKSYQLQEDVIFLGSVAPEEMDAYTAVGDVLILPSLSEGLARVSLEALHARKGIIASNKGGNPEVVEPGINGFLIEPHDVEKLSKYIVEFVNNPSLPRKMGTLGRNIAETKFNRTHIIDQYENLYYETLKKTNAIPLEVIESEEN